VLLVDTNDTLLKAVSEWLVSDSTTTVVGTAGSGTDALRLVHELRPDLVLMDATLPDASGFEITRRIKKAPDAPVVALMTLHQSAAARVEAIAAGADQLVTGSDLVGQLMPLVHRLRDLAEDGSRVSNKSTKGPGQGAVVRPNLPDSPTSK